MNGAVPVLRVGDWGEPKAFYVDWLGFALDWEFRFGDDFPAYAQVARDGITLHLTQHAGDCAFGGLAHIEVDDIESLLQAWDAGRPAAALPRPKRMPWNALALRVPDPFGNHLSIQQTLDGDGT
ncbi:MAG TPA: glyoxalase superfamily protein [Tepidisphaeraceae bacterium]|nr:glyoxalase superfamily protein [Tepidisphaeraceae bacterium]